MDYYEIGQRVRRLRKARGLSQEQLAERAGISVTHMSHIETGNTKLSLPVLVSLSEALSVPADDLLHEPVTAKTASFREIAALLEGCSARQLQIIADIVRAAKNALDRYGGP